MKKNGPAISTEHTARLLSRRKFLIGSALLAASASGAGLSCMKSPQPAGRPVGGSILGGNYSLGHRLLKPESVSTSDISEAGIVIVGGGIAGLIAARELKKKGFGDFLLLELEERLGGNSASAEHEVSPYPFGAHYIPIPGKEAVLTRKLFEELGIIEGYDNRGLPIYNEYYLCAEPQERLFVNGWWQEGLVPQHGASDDDLQQYKKFFKMMNDFKTARGSDGRRAFVIPVEQSSRDSRFIKYDNMSMAEFLSENGFDSERLRWYVNYCCRDDYGCIPEKVSAWAGIHYFAARTGRAANAEPNAVVTWPEGNGWIVKKLAEPIKEHIRKQACVLDIRNAGSRLQVDYMDASSGKIRRLVADAVIYAAPRFTALRTIRDFRESPPEYAASFGYAPWMVANIVVRSVPEGNGAPLSWDNVVYGSDFLGYVAANHQDLRMHPGKSVLTYYYPMTLDEPAAERTRAVNTSFEKWRDMIISDLSRVHPGIEEKIEEIYVWIWGHAMVRPVPGLIWGEARQKALKPHGKIFFAHSDMSGLSIFEEAQYRGVLAAGAALKTLRAASG